MRDFLAQTHDLLLKGGAAVAGFFHGTAAQAVSCACVFQQREHERQRTGKDVWIEQADGLEASEDGGMKKAPAFPFWGESRGDAV